MTDDTRNSVGVDISKAHLDAHMVPAGKAARFSNDAAGFKALIAWVEHPVRAVTYEPTGRWHRAFEEALFKAELPLARVNPLQARRFAQAIGQRAKTDAVDARMLAQMGAALDLRRTEASSPAQRALEELQVARDALVKDRTAALNRQKQLQHRLLRRQNTNRLSQIDRQLAAIDAEIGKCLFSVNYFCRLASTIFAGSGRRESRSTTMTPVGRVGVACDVQSGVENALPRRCTVAPLLARVFHAAGAVHRLLGFRSIPAFRRSTVGGRGAAAGPGARPRGAGAAGDFRRDRSVW